MNGQDESTVWVDLEAVYDAPDEDSAIHVQALLKSAGFDARIRSAQVPCFDGAFASAVGYWGQVVVPRETADGARELLKDLKRRLALRLLSDDGHSGSDSQREPGGEAERC
jgi:hypothetical protein